MKPLRAISRFCRSERGDFSIEMLPWVLVTGLVLTLITDAAYTLNSCSSVLRTIQDGNRLVSIGMIRDPAEAENYVEQLIGAIYPDAQATTVIDTTAGRVQTQVSIPWASLRVIGLLARSDQPAITMSATHGLEWS